MTQRWKNRPEGANWGEFGADDQRGRLNLITREKVLQGLAEAREGLTFCLSLPLDHPGGSDLNPRRKPPILRPTIRGDQPNFNAVWDGCRGRGDGCLLRRSRHPAPAIFDPVGRAVPCRIAF